MNRELTENERSHKHMELNWAVNDLRSIVDHVNELLNEIVGPKSEPICAKDNGAIISEPTFAEVLSQSPDKIRKRIAETHEIIEQIRNQLF